MICSRCRQDAVVWVGPMSQLGNHGTRCRNCGATNSQVIEPEDDGIVCMACGQVVDDELSCPGCGEKWLP